ncbi:hypothetical protein VNI00_015695 [Paramarasmius palmivorus]|uniref:F-box domain-containing protein n=1 Tax=Paramarasmius palmivorus TaxID=297713 RepID=A0AAW0BH85_9AGAR
MSVVPDRDVLKTSHPTPYFPTELLCEIFKYLIPQRPEDDFGLVLTHVCRHWRDIAIGLHFLWTFPDFRSPELAKEMLKRSGQAPLRIQFKHCDLKFPSTGVSPDEYLIPRIQLLSEALLHSHRLETIELDIDCISLEALVEKHKKAAPSLRSLHITSDDGSHLPIDFLGGTAPLLVDMALNGCGLEYNSPLLSNLTSLKLTGGYETDLEERFCDALHFMPVLECLYLDEVYYEAPAANTPVANLPMLRKLDIKCSYLDSSRIFNHISFPGTALVQITVFDIDVIDATVNEMDTFWADVTRVFSPNFCPGYQRDVKTLAATGADTTSFVLRTWHTPLPPGFSTSNSEHAALYPPNVSTRINWSKKGSAQYGDRVLFETIFKATFRTLHTLQFPALETIAFPADLMKYALTSHWPSKPLQKLILHGSCYVE